MYRFNRLLLVAVALLVSACASTTRKTSDGYLPGVEPINGPRYRAKIQVDLATAYYGRGKYGIALEELNRALKTDPRYAPADSLRGIIYAQLGEWTKARQFFVRAFENDPKNPDIQNNYGWFLCQTGHARQGSQYIKEALQNPLYETPDKAYGNLAFCYLELRDYPSALKVLNRAIKLNSSNVQAYFYRSRAFFEQADYQSARTDIRVVLDKYRFFTPKTLQMAVNIESKLGKDGHPAFYAAELVRRFPNSEEARAYVKSD